MTSTVLVADDDQAIRLVLSQALGRIGLSVKTTGDVSTLWRWIEEGEGDVVVTDVIMPDGNGIELIPRIRKFRPHLKIIVMSAQNTLLTAVKATEKGAFEYLPKPFDLAQLVGAVKRALEAKQSHSQISEALPASGERLPLIGRSPAMQEIYRVLARLMATDLTVMIVGESGTGKELIARALHDYGKRRNGPFVALNMAAIPRELIESELFGHEKGSFTGATARTPGRFEQAKGGTLFLDEIGDMPLEAQTRLLRVLQEGEYTTVGGQNPIRADVRIIAATHRDLKILTRQGLFREDLFYRLNVVPIRVPPLRERVDDIGDLVRHFLEQAATEGLPHKILEQSALEELRHHHWPGNVRELENLARRLAALYPYDTITADTIKAELAENPHHTPGLSGETISAGADNNEGLGSVVERQLRNYFDAHRNDMPASGLYDRIIREVEKPLIELTLNLTRGNQIKAAYLLGLNRNTLRKKIRDLDIDLIRGVK